MAGCAKADINNNAIITTAVIGFDKRSLIRGERLRNDGEEAMSRIVVSAAGVTKVVPTAAGQLVILDGIDLEINAIQDH